MLTEASRCVGKILEMIRLGELSLAARDVSAEPPGFLAAPSSDALQGWLPVMIFTRNGHSCRFITSFDSSTKV